MSKKLTILTMGDSITDAGRNRENPTVEYGNGYAAILAAMLRTRLPEYDITFVNSGINGDTTQSNLQRWEKDVEAYQPDYMTWLIGINDAYVTTFAPEVEEVKLPNYEKLLRDLSKRARDNGVKGIVYLSPFYLLKPEDTETSEAMTKATAPLAPLYRDVMKKVAEDEGMPFIDLYDMFMDEMTRVKAELLAPDLVHPVVYAHGLIAQRACDALIGLIEGK
ncbi:MAG: hypothetical protein IKD06_00900 [Clostridia bacterium]|nr:hypothetical protein [Clostridia bacterium]